MLLKGNVDFNDVKRETEYSRRPLSIMVPESQLRVDAAYTEQATILEPKGMR
jgi:hypothetical protein